MKTETTSPREPLLIRDPSLWMMVAAVFIMLIAAWAVLIIIANKNKPPTVPLENEGTRLVEPVKNQP